MHLSGRITRSPLKRLGYKHPRYVDAINVRHVQFEDYFLGSKLNLSRPHRRLAALAGVGIGVLAMYDIETLRSTFGEMQS